MEDVSARVTLSIASLIVGSLIYKFLNVRPSRYYPITRADAYIPLLPMSVIPYILYYPALFGSFVVLSYTQHFFPFFLTMGVSSLLLWIIWYVFPTGVKRPTISIPNTWAEKLLVHFYTNDRDTNAAPSGHVVHTLVAAYFLILAFPTLWWIIGIGTLGITASTVTTKQHYLLDVITGIVMTIVVIAPHFYWGVLKG